MINDRLALLGDYPFRRLAELLKGAEPPQDKKAIIMSIGEPQLPPPPIVGEMIAQNLHLFGRYPPAAGTPEFRQACLGWLMRRYGLPEGLVGEANIVPAPGTREALFMIALAVVPTSKNGLKPAVLMPNPFYQAYVGASVIGGADPVFLETGPATGHLPDLDRLDRKLLERTALFYLCSPSNPQGVFADEGYLARLLGLAREFGFVLAVDECYAEIYHETPPPGSLQVCGGQLDNLVVFHSLSKRSSVPGMRSGFVAGDPNVITALLRVMEYGGAGMPFPIQAAAAALWNDDEHVEIVRDFYRHNIQTAERIIGNRFGFRRPPGGFFLWLDVDNGEAAARKLWQAAALRTLPGRYLTRDQADGSNSGHSFLRVALVHPPAVTAEGLGRLAETL